jgi:hypothetical protein
MKKHLLQVVVEQDEDGAYVASCPAEGQSWLRIKFPQHGGAHGNKKENPIY